MYGDIVLRVPRHEFEKAMKEVKAARGITADTDLTAADLKEIVGRDEQIVRQRTGHEFPDDPREQLWGAIGAVFRSWENERARTYRKLHHIPDDWGTAVNVQAMVFGNLGDTSATGVAFTRDPASGERSSTASSPNAQGEDVVAGIRRCAPERRRPASRSETMKPARSSCWCATGSALPQCRTSSSRSRTTSSTCSRRATESARASRRCASRPTWSTRA
jgi:pyruvate,orthophosphate dikinase